MEGSLPSSFSGIFQIPEDAVVADNVIEWKDQTYGRDEITLIWTYGTDKGLPKFRVAKKAQLSHKLVDLIMTAKNIPEGPSTQSHNFGKAFSFLDGRISESTGWHTPNSKNFSIKTDKCYLSGELERVEREVLGGKKGVSKSQPKLWLDSENKFLKYLQGPKLTNEHNHKALHLGKSLKNINSEEVEAEYSLRQTSATACKITEALETIQKALEVIPKMSVIHSIQDRDEKIKQVGLFVEYTKQIASNHAINLTKKALSYKAATRENVARFVSPIMIKDKLTKSNLLETTLINQEDLAAADSMASQTAYLKTESQTNRGNRPFFKRPFPDSDPTIRKKTRPADRGLASPRDPQTSISQQGQPSRVTPAYQSRPNLQYRPIPQPRPTFQPRSATNTRGRPTQAFRTQNQPRKTLPYNPYAKSNI